VQRHPFPAASLLRVTLRADATLGVELVRRRVAGEPLLDAEPGLGARGRGVVPSGGDLHGLAVPAVVRAVAVGGEVHPARRRRQAGRPVAEDVHVAALVVVVAGAHEPAPPGQVQDGEAGAVGGPESQADHGVRPGLPDRPRLHVDRVHAPVVVVVAPGRVDGRALQRHHRLVVRRQWSLSGAGGLRM